MNIPQLRYIVEIEKTRSITKAAENLYMGQPNLSRSIREFEQELGFRIFKRTQRGMLATEEGQELLARAKAILEQIDAIEQISIQDGEGLQRLGLAAPRASYISHAFTRFAAGLDGSRPIHLDYKETNAMGAIEAVEEKRFSLGIVRYQHSHEPSFMDIFKQKKLAAEEVACFGYRLLMSAAHPLAKKPRINAADLTRYIEVTHGDPYTPSLHLAQVRKAENQPQADKHIYVYERGSQFDLLCDVPTTYIWVSPVPGELLSRHGLVQRECEGAGELYKDVLVTRKDYKLTALDKRLIDEICAARREVFK